MEGIFVLILLNRFLRWDFFGIITDKFAHSVNTRYNNYVFLLIRNTIFSAVSMEIKLWDYQRGWA